MSGTSRKEKGTHLKIHRVLRSIHLQFDECSVYFVLNQSVSGWLKSSRLKVGSHEDVCGICKHRRGEIGLYYIVSTTRAVRCKLFRTLTRLYLAIVTYSCHSCILKNIVKQQYISPILSMVGPHLLGFSGDGIIILIIPFHMIVGQKWDNEILIMRK